MTATGWELAAGTGPEEVVEGSSVGIVVVSDVGVAVVPAVVTAVVTAVDARGVEG